MITSASDCSTKKSWRTGKTSGWAAFDLEQQRKLSLEPEANDKLFPPISSSILRSSGNLVFEKPFASMVHNPVNFLRSGDADNLDNTLRTANGFSKKFVTNMVLNENCRERSDFMAHKMLKQCYTWADDSLIDNVLAGVNNDIEQASILMRSMLPEINCTVNDNVESNEVECTFQQLCVQGGKSPEALTADRVKLSRLLEEARKYSNDELSLNVGNLKFIQTYLNSVPTEPEWEEDDIYLFHRKDALRMMRSALHHSKAATDSYRRGEHLLAQKHSLKAREEWMATNRLNDMAAKEILKIRNAKNDQWTLDLHGLHASEAVRALEERLRKIESAEPNIVEVKSGNVVSAPYVSTSDGDVARLSRRSLPSIPSPSFKPRRAPLQVITGKGNHSRGEAALPAAIKSFLVENGYKFDETRPGVITVRPKLRL